MTLPSSENLCPGLQLARLVAAPVHEQPVLRGAGPQGVDVTEAHRADAGQHRLLALHLDVLVSSPPGHDAHQRHVRGREHGHERGQPWIVCEHQEQEEGAHDELDDDAGELRGRGGGDLVDELHALAQVTGEPMGEVLHREPEQVLQKAVPVDHRQADGELSQTALLQIAEQIGQRCRGTRGGDQDGTPRGGLPAAQHMVHQHAEQRRQGKTGNRQQQSARGGERERRLDRPQPLPEHADDAGSDTAGLERGAALGKQHHAGERPVELFRGDRTAAVGGVVDVVAPAAEALEDDEVVELPEQYRGEGHVGPLNPARLHAPSGEPQSVLLRRIHDVGGAARIATDPAGATQLFEGHPAAMVREEDAETGGAALGRLELQVKRRTNLPAAGPPPAHQSLPTGSSRETGGWRCMTTWSRQGCPSIVPRAGGGSKSSRIR